MSRTANGVPWGRRRRHVVIGTGSIAHAHASAVAASGGRAEVVHAVDAEEGRAASFAARHGVPAWGSDLAVALAERPDLVHICTPPGTHASLAVQCLEAGVPVLVEKPPALSLAELDTVVGVSDRTGVHAAVVFQHRFGNAARRFRALLDAGALGRPLVATCDTLWFRSPEYFEAPWRGSWEAEGGGPTMGHGIHQFDLLLALLGPWAEVTAMAGRQARDTATEDVSTALVRFENGALATVANSLVSPRETSMLRIDTERATVELTHLYGYGEDDWTVTPAPGQDGVLDLWRRGAAGASAGAGDGRSGHHAQLAAVLDAMDTGAPLPVPLTEARDTLELVAAIYASAFTGERVRRGDIGPGHPFHGRMDGPGAPWSGRAAIGGASR